jgi:hypothetical protein
MFRLAEQAVTALKRRGALLRFAVGRLPGAEYRFGNALYLKARTAKLAPPSPASAALPEPSTWIPRDARIVVRLGCRRRLN